MLQAFLCFFAIPDFKLCNSGGEFTAEKQKGMIAGLFYSIYGFLLDPNVLTQLFYIKKKYEMYQINVLICWISPLNQAVYGNNLAMIHYLPKSSGNPVYFFLKFPGSNTDYSALRRMKYPLNFWGKNHEW